MGGLSPLHLVIVLVVALLVVGPGKLPEVGAALGQAVKGMRDALDGVDEARAAVPAEAAPAAPAPAAPAPLPAVPGPAPEPVDRSDA